MQERFIVSARVDKGCIGDIDAPSREDAIGEIIPLIEKALMTEEYIEMEVITYKVNEEGDVI